MQSIFEKLYNGEISPDATEYGKNPAYQKALQVKIGYFDKLNATFSKSQKELHDDYIEAHGIVEGVVHRYLFSYALRLGILLMVEAFANEDKAAIDGVKITIESMGNEE